MGSNFIVVVKYKNEDRIVLHSAKSGYKEAKEVKNYLQQLGHIAEVIPIAELK